jgi:hypothetical protein
LLSIIVTYNVLYEREKRRQGREILFLFIELIENFHFRYSTSFSCRSISRT